MYKVFIDNWPIHFVYKSTNLTSVENSSIVVFNDSIKLEDLLTLHTNYKIKGHQLIVEIENESQLFKTLFASYKMVNAAGGVVINNDNQLLLIERLGCWDLPKGKIEKGESIESAAVREVEEECGITNPMIQQPLIKTYHAYFMKGKNCFKTTYWFEMRYEGSELLVPQNEEGITKVEWRDLNNLVDVFNNTYLSIAEVLNDFLKKS